MIIKQKHTPFSLAPVATAALLAFAAPLPVLAQEQTYAFDIPAQELGAALRTFARAAHQQVTFNDKVVQGKRTVALKGTFTARAALEKLLDSTGLSIQTGKSGLFIIHDGTPVSENGKASRDETYSTIGALQVAQIELAEASSDTMVAEAAKDKSKKDSKNADVEEMIVQESKIKPFVDGNADIRRTINDSQPYYIFDSETIQRSAAVNVEDFLKQHLTMNTVAATSSQRTSGAGDSYVSSFQGATSSINLRGLGADKTLVLINGRRVAGVNTGRNNLGDPGVPGQPDLNSIPLGAIERIEVLPTSASGIYGANALGGVVNVILKKNYTGGDLRVAYSSPWDTDSANRSANFNYGMGFNGGKTHVGVHASWTDNNPMLLQDRRGLLDRGMAIVRRNVPTYFGDSSINSSTFLGALPNIVSAGYTDPVTGQTVFTFTNTTLTLKDGRALSASYTYVPAGISPSTPQSVLIAGLIANAGRQSLDLPPTAQSPTGLYRILNMEADTKTYGFTVRQQLREGLELTFDGSHSENVARLPRSVGFVYNGIPASNPSNPFKETVYLSNPNPTQFMFDLPTDADSLSMGITAKLPHEWSAQADYSWSRSSIAYDLPSMSNAEFSDFDALLARLNPFVDQVAYPLDASEYDDAHYLQDFSSYLHNASVRASGPLSVLPWGAVMLTTGLERRVAETPSTNYNTFLDPLIRTSSFHRAFFKRQSIVSSIYAEALIPLVRQNQLPLLYSLELQLSERIERFAVDVGTRYKNLDPYTGATLSYSTPNIDANNPYFAKDTYNSNNKTIGFKYQPLSNLILRASLATAFLPPTSEQLLKNPVPNPTPTNVTDPRNNNVSVAVRTISGGNPDLLPQNSKSWNAGIVWQPTVNLIKDLRFNAEYYRLKQFDAIGSLSAQLLLANESFFANRITRNANGQLLFIDTSMLNLYRLETEGWDLTVGGRLPTSLGTFSLNATESILLRNETQYSLTLPAYDSVGFPSEGGAAKYKSTATLTWERANWAAGWTARYIGSYKQYGALGGPDATRRRATNPNAALSTQYIAPQGGDTIPAQMYHDLFVSYEFGKASPGNAFVSRMLADVTVQFGVRNVFNKWAPFDVYYDFYTSPYEGLQLRNYSLSARKSF